MALDALQRLATGLDATGLVTRGAYLLERDAAAAFDRLAADARGAGFELAVASAYRSFERQLRIWNGKLSGEREVLDDEDRVIDLLSLSPLQRVERVLRFSALPGASRHHWGTDLDVYDAAAMPSPAQVRLCYAEVCEGGPCAPLHAWLDERMAAGESHGFFRPYDRDRGGVAPERWHLSYAPGAVRFAAALTPAVVRAAWDETAGDGGLLQREIVEAELPALFERFVTRVAQPVRAG